MSQAQSNLDTHSMIQQIRLLDEKAKADRENFHKILEQLSLEEKFSFKGTPEEFETLIKSLEKAENVKKMEKELAELKQKVEELIPALEQKTAVIEELEKLLGSKMSTPEDVKNAFLSGKGASFKPERPKFRLRDLTKFRNASERHEKFSFMRLRQIHEARDGRADSGTLDDTISRKRARLDQTEPSTATHEPPTSETNRQSPTTTLEESLSIHFDLMQRWRPRQDPSIAYISLSHPNDNCWKNPPPS